MGSEVCQKGAGREMKVPLRNEPAELTYGQFEDLVKRADAYILALRQVIYSGRPEIRRLASERLNELGSCWQAARDSYASEIPPC
jgi:hypothetical protein